MIMNISPILLARSKSDVVLLPQMANRHGLIAGATGTGKTVTLQVLAENFSAVDAGVGETLARGVSPRCANQTRMDRLRYA
jgi:Cdc6-like AAA superfamily ATPase